MIFLGIAGSLESLKNCIPAAHPVLAAARSAPTLAIVFAAGTRADLREAVFDLLDDSQAVTTFNANPGVTSDLVTRGLRRSQWIDVDVDARAPRLRTVRLPKSLVQSEAVVGVADLRQVTRARPLIALGLWALLTAPAQRIGSLITGPREGLTAEIGLAIQPAALIVLTQLTASGPLICIMSHDPIAAELTALAIWQSRLPSTVDLPGPWEDPLVQRASELGLGATQPSQLEVESRFGSDLSANDVASTQHQLSAALSLIGVDHRVSDRNDV
jgi:hypothetical protein